VRWCARCILPDSRPKLSIGKDGVCSACHAHEKKDNIDWSARASLFEGVVANAKRRSSGYDCVIPVSGGKDSTWQVVTCLEHALNPLAVTWKTPARTAVGQRNLDNLVSLGVDHIDYRINPRVESAFVKAAFELHGAPALPMHMALFSIPLKIAVRFGIPLVVWGENSAFEYAGEDAAAEGFRLDATWLRDYGVTQGTTARDWVSDDLSHRELTPYFGPSSEELSGADTLAVFLGYYFRWDPQRIYDVARAHGFVADDRGARTGYYSFADIDDDFISVHHFLKWYKFGFTRLFDNLSLEIRNGRLTRDEAIEIVRHRGPEIPIDDIEAFSDFIGITVPDFFRTAERFRNAKVWTRRGETWVIEDFLIEDWPWA
jgi:N-acetyl sugar amidotransferase